MLIVAKTCQRQTTAGKPTNFADPSLPGLKTRQIKAKPLVNEELFSWHGYCLGSKAKGNFPH